MNVIDRIKTFEDACKEIDKGINHSLVQAYRCWDNDGMCNQPDIDAFLKLRIICTALNEGWEPRFTEDEYRYYPWFYLYTEDEIQDIGKDESSISISDYYVTDYIIFATSGSENVPSDAPAGFGARLALKSEELAIYCGKQFINLWTDLNLIRR